MTPKDVLLSQFDLHTVLYNNVIDQVSEDESDLNLLESFNNIKFLAGHLLWAQNNLCRRFGVINDIPWINYFKSGQDVSVQTETKDERPSLEEIKGKWEEITSKLRDALANQSEKELYKELEGKPVMPQFSNNLAGWWAFVNHHQAFHLGQIAILRRGLDKKAMSYF